MRRLWIYGLLWLSINSLMAQHALEVGVRGGVASLLYKTEVATPSVRENIGFDIAYNYISPYFVGWRIGVSADYSVSSLKATGYEDAYDCTDVEFDKMHVHYTMQRWQEKHRQIYLSIPLQFSVGYKHFSFHVGPKIMLPVLFGFEEEAIHVDLQCSYPDYQSTVTQALALAAGDRALQTREGKVVAHPKLWFTVSAELGYSWILTKHHALRLSIYADVAINQYNLTKTDNISAIMLTDTRYTIPVERQLETMFYANHHLKDKQVVESYRYLAAGIKLTWRFRIKDVSKYNKLCNCYPDEL